MQRVVIWRWAKGNGLSFSLSLSLSCRSGQKVSAGLEERNIITYRRTIYRARSRLAVLSRSPFRLPPSGDTCESYQSSSLEKETSFSRAILSPCDRRTWGRVGYQFHGQLVRRSFRNREYWRRRGSCREVAGLRSSRDAFSSLTTRTSRARRGKSSRDSRRQRLTLKVIITPCARAFATCDIDTYLRRRSTATANLSCVFSADSADQTFSISPVWGDIDKNDVQQLVHLSEEKSSLFRCAYVLVI